MIGTNAAGLMAPCLKLTYSRLTKITQARIIHEHFCCNRRSAATTSFRLAGSPLTVLHDYASGPQGSARWSRNAAQQFRDEPS